MSLPADPADAVWVGLDIGTQSLKVGVYRADGRTILAAARKLSIHNPSPGAMVQDPDEWWTASQDLLARAAAQIPPGSVGGIGLCATFPTFCLVGPGGDTIGEGVLYGDTRAAEFVAAASDVVQVPLRGDEVSPRLMWLANTDSDRMRSAWQATGPAGLVALRLTGALALDRHSAARWGGLAVAGGQDWDLAAVQALGIEHALLPPIAAATEIVGRLTPAASRSTGMSVGVPVVMGTTDSLASILGNGAGKAGDTFIYYGSSAYVAQCTLDLRVLAAGGGAFAEDAPYRLLGYAEASGLFLDHLSSALDGSLDRLDALAGAVAPGAEGLTVLLPSETSSRAVSGMGAIVGLDEHHGSGHIWRAALEALTPSLWGAVPPADPQMARAGGGGARSGVWRQIVSDMTGWTQGYLPVGSATRGAAFLAMLGAGGASWDEAHPVWFAEGIQVTRPGGPSSRYAELQAAGRGARQELAARFAVIEASFGAA